MCHKGLLYLQNLFCNRSQRTVRVTGCFTKHLFVPMSVKQNFFVSVFVHKCLMVLNNVEYTIIKMFVTQISNYLFVISFKLMFYKKLRCSLARPYKSQTVSKNLFIIIDVKEVNFSEKTLFSQ